MAAAVPGGVQDEKAVVFEENNKVRIKADELGEQQRQLRGKDGPECITMRSQAWNKSTFSPLFFAAPEAKDEGNHVKVIPLPLNPAQVPNPLQPRHAKDLVPPEAVHHRQSESPLPLERQVFWGPRGLNLPNASRFQLSFVAPPLPTVASSSMKGV